MMTVVVLHPEEDLIPTERIGLVASWLALGERLTAEQVKKKTGYCRVEDAERLLRSLSRVLPITEYEGVWYWCGIG